MAKGTTSIGGNATVLAVDSNGGEVWRTTISGRANLADLKVLDDGIVVSGESFSEVDLGVESIDSGMFFVLKLDKKGNPEWSYHNDSLDGEHSSLAVDPTGNVWAAAQVLFGFFGNTTLLKIDKSGSIVQRKEMKGITVSEMTFDDNGDLFFTGMMVRKTVVDTVEMNPPFGYANIVAKLDKGKTAVWARFTQYITFDWHHKLECVGDKIFVFHRRLIAVNTPEASVIRYSKEGKQEGSFALSPNQLWPSADLSTADNNLFVLYERWNYSNPAVNDTLVSYTLNSDLEVQDSMRITGQVPGSFWGVQPFHIASDDCGFSIGTMISTDSVTFDSEVIRTSNTGNSIAVYSQGLCNEVLNLVNIQTMDGLRVYPNPSSDRLNIEWAESGSTAIEIYDLRGVIQYKGTHSANFAEVNVENWPAGIYSYRVIQGQITTNGKFVVR